MKKGRVSNLLQRTFIFGSVAMLAIGVFFNSGSLTKADGTVASKVEKCALQSVSLKVTTDENAEEEVYTGGLKTVIVGKDVSWSDYFLIRTISGAEYITDDTCTSKTYFDKYGGDYHGDVSGYVYFPNYTGDEIAYTGVADVQTKEGDSGAWVEWIMTEPYAENAYRNLIYYQKQVEAEWSPGDYYTQSYGYVKLNEDAGYYDVKFEPRYGMVDGVSPTGIYVRFAKEYDLTYNLDGGVLADTDANTYVAGSGSPLPIPTKEGFYFTGWTTDDVTTPTREYVIPIDSTGDLSFTANWIETKDIVTCDITLKDGDSYTYTGVEIKPEVVVKDGEKLLVEGKDYEVSYANNVNVAGKEAGKAPTVIVTGLNTYEGSKEITFTITKGSLSVETTPSVAAIVEGQKLSDSVLTGGRVVNEKKVAVEGKFAWKDGNVVPTLADSGVTKYIVVFTAKDAVNYETAEIDVVVTVNAKANDSGERPDPTPQPQPTPNPEDGKTDQVTVAVGTKVEDAEKKATYAVTKAADGAVEVLYVKPTKKTTSVTIPDAVTLADGTKAEVTAIDAKAFKDNKRVKTITIGKNVVTIGSQAFKGCKNLKTVKGAKGIKTIGKEAFANCTKLTSVAMGNSLESIGEKAFYKCKALKKIAIPKSVKSIGKSAFQDCKKLKSITIKTTKLTKKNVKKNAFKGIPNTAKIDVPNSKKKAYKTLLQSRGVSKNATIK